MTQPYTPPSLNPLKAQFLNLLLTRDWVQECDLFGNPCFIAADPWQLPFAPACGLDLNVGQERWRVLFSSATLLGLHPSGVLLAKTPNLPEALRLALFELSLAPVLHAVGAFFALDTPPEILAEATTPPKNCACTVPLTLSVSGEKIALTLYIPTESVGQKVLLRLRQEKTRHNPLPRVDISLGLQVGAMVLTVSELQALQPEDILLPESYPGSQGECCLALAPGVGIRCAVDKGRATVLGFERHPPRFTEPAMRRKEMADTLPQTAPHETVPQKDTSPKDTSREDTAQEHTSPTAINLATLDVSITFELERRLMTLAEIAALAPGYTFSLPANLMAPVTIRANGKAVGAGRLVDLDGVLGVQVVNLERE